MLTHPGSRNQDPGFGAGTPLNPDSRLLNPAFLAQLLPGTEVHGRSRPIHGPRGTSPLKQERVLERLEQTAYDIVVLDEAHHCMDLGAATEREDSQRRRLAQVLARRCDAFLLLTATPHDGNDRSFASLCELLDPSLVDGRGALRGEAYRNHVVRRLKKQVKDPVTGKELFRVRPNGIESRVDQTSRYQRMKRAPTRAVVRTSRNFRGQPRRRAVVRRGPERVGVTARGARPSDA